MGLLYFVTSSFTDASKESESFMTIWIVKNLITGEKLYYTV